MISGSSAMDEWIAKAFDPAALDMAATDLAATIDSQYLETVLASIKPRYVACPVCKGWIVAGTLGPKGCPHCKGSKV